MRDLNVSLKESGFKQAFIGKKVIVVTPGSGIERHKIKKVKLLEKHLGFIRSYELSDVIPYHAHTDRYRFLQFKQALSGKSKIIWSLRGGYGAARIIPELDKLPIPKNKKIFIGYSDNTALHLFLTQKWHWQTIHGEGLSGLLDPQKDPLNFIKIAEIINRQVKHAKINNLVPLNIAAQHINVISGSLTGGNLTLIQNSIGTSWQIKAKNKILFLEDVKEAGYKLDRTLTHLQQAGVFKYVKAIVFGNFVEGDQYVDLALTRFATECKVPVFKTHEFGHAIINYPLIYNSKSKIKRQSKESYELVMQIF